MRVVVALVLLTAWISPAPARYLFPVEPAGRDLIVLTVKADQDGLGEINWAGADRRFSPRASYPFYVRAADQPRSYYFNLKAYADPDRVRYLLLFLPGSGEVVSLLTVKATVPQKIAAAWQELWGPQGRELTGSTFLVFDPIKVGGRSLFVYLNGLILLSLIISLLWKKPRWTLGLILVLWATLELNSLLIDRNFLRADLNLWGKGLSEKRIAQNFSDFYRFIEFAAENMPPDATFHLLHDPKYRFSIERAAYYLVPRTWQNENPDHVLLYGREPEQALLESYRLHAAFRPGAYVMVKK